MFSIPQNTMQDSPASLFETLNSGPNFRAITSARHDTLPTGWRLSFGRVSPVAFQGNAAALSKLAVSTLGSFEMACAQLLQRNAPVEITAGIQTHEDMLQYYVSGSPFSVRRLDLVVGENNHVAISENDEMPGGIVHAYLLDYAYGINQERWTQAFEYLCSAGGLVFVVSDEWSAPYVNEIKWFVWHLQQRGYDVDFVLASNAQQRLQVRATDVLLDKSRTVGTIWRLFPIFETKGILAELVRAAYDKKVRMAPEFASWGNKAWMATFWQQQTYFRQALGADTFELLRSTIPYAEVASSDQDFPRNILTEEGFVELSSMNDLESLPKGSRRQLVLKTTGAHQNAARSFGVLMGTSYKGSAVKWAEQVRPMFKLGAPVLLQSYIRPALTNVPAWNVLSGNVQAEPEFEGRILLRPWVVGGALLSCTAFVVPNTMTKIHGNAAGIEVPLDLG